jgi:hypothetical protein
MTYQLVSPSTYFVVFQVLMEPTGASMRGHFDYDIKTIAPVDDKAEVYYSIKGTDKKFSILIRTDWNKNEDNANPYLVKMSYDDLQTKDSASGNIFPIPLQGRSAGAASWTLTGSEKYGYWSSANPPVAWMSSIMDVIGDRKLKHVAMPGSHDAGISKLNGGTFGKLPYSDSVLSLIIWPNWADRSKRWKLQNASPQYSRSASSWIAAFRP